MAMGQPIVAFDLKETRHTAQEAAVYVGDPSGRAMAAGLLALLEDPERREEMARVGRERVRASLSWESQEPDLLRAYELALRSR
jgi:glycosyltransferase involved in cell wall biosynthesis